MNMNRKLAIIIACQTLLIILLFWLLVIYGKDEYETSHKSNLDDIKSPQHVTEKQGVSIVSVPVAVQQSSQISTARLIASKHQTSVNNASDNSYGVVVNIDGLIEATNKLAMANTEADLARAGTQTNQQDYQRLKLLNADDKNVSDRAVQAAEALVKADLARIKNADANYQAIKKTLQLQWGETLAKLATQTKPAPYLAALLTRKNVLVQMSLRSDSKILAQGTTIQIQSLNDAQVISAAYVSPAMQTDSFNGGATYYFSAPAERLRVGMRVKSQVSTIDASQTTGVIIPNSALVWYGGKPWVYIKQDGESFMRRPVNASNEVTGGWFNAAGFKAEDEVVVSGAQLLLSEEFKYQIKNENED